jgi:hypothetical protein
LLPGHDSSSGDRRGRIKRCELSDAEWIAIKPMLPIKPRGVPRLRRMKKVAVFGNTGGGKSTLARKLATLTQLPLCPVDLIQFRPRGGGRVPHAEYLAAHAALIGRDAWIIDGFGCAASSLARFAAADTLIYVDLPLATHYALLVGDEAPAPGAFRRARRMAGEKSDLELDPRQPARRRPLRPRHHAEIPAACGGRGGVEARAPPALARRDARFRCPGGGGASRALRLRRAAFN